MDKPPVASSVAVIAAAITAVVVAAALYWLTRDEASVGACASSERDVGAAVLADSDSDQEALVNRAIIVRGKCEQDERD